MEPDKILVVIAGPTAVGKTAVAIRLAIHFRTEIVSADSRQFFRELSIGTAKPVQKELSLVPHHFINSHSITDDYDAASYATDALAVISKLFTTHNVVILCGGSGLYIKAVTDGFDDIPEVAKNIRAELIAGFEANGISWLQDKMRSLDPEHFAMIDQLNPQRLIRALEVRIATGQSIAKFQSKRKASHPFRVLKIGLDLPREQLYQRIDARMDAMIGQGLFEEAKSVYAYRDKNALQTVGYKEIFDFLDGRYDYAEAVRLLKQNTRHYAKRQLTWFRRDADTVWFHPDDVEGMIGLVKNFLGEEKAQHG